MDVWRTLNAQMNQVLKDIPHYPKGSNPPTLNPTFLEVQFVCIVSENENYKRPIKLLRNAVLAPVQKSPQPYKNTIYANSSLLFRLRVDPSQCSAVQCRWVQIMAVIYSVVHCTAIHPQTGKIHFFSKIYLPFKQILQLLCPFGLWMIPSMPCYHPPPSPTMPGTSAHNSHFI